jgi:hypothetical protein
MTCIAGAVDPLTGDVCIGGDSAAIAEYDMLNMSLPKVFIKDGFAFGFAGHFRFAQVVQYTFQPPKFRGGDVVEYLSRDFAEHLRLTVKAIGYSKNKEGRDEGGLALIGFQKRLFLMQDEFDVIETRDGISAIGCGFPYALGALKAMDTNMAINYRVQHALWIAEYYSGGVRAPFTLVTLEGSDVTAQSTSARRNSGNRGAKTKAPTKRARSRS